MNQIDRLVRCNLWEVCFDSVFESSSGTDRYSKEDKNNTGYVTTSSADISSVVDELNKYLGSQTRVTKLHYAKWLGQLLNDYT